MGGFSIRNRRPPPQRVATAPSIAAVSQNAGQPLGAQAALSAQAIALQTPRGFQISGYAIATSINFDGSGAVNLVVTKIVTTTKTVATLPGSPTAGQREFVSDSNATMTAGIGAIVAGSGINGVPVYYDGTNWRIG